LPRYGPAVDAHLKTVYGFMVSYDLEYAFGVRGDPSGLSLLKTPVAA
jgi:hypothetical protein